MDGGNPLRRSSVLVAVGLGGWVVELRWRSKKVVLLRVWAMERQSDSAMVSSSPPASMAGGGGSARAQAGSTAFIGKG